MPDAVLSTTVEIRQTNDILVKAPGTYLGSTEATQESKCFSSEHPRFLSGALELCLLGPQRPLPLSHHSGSSSSPRVPPCVPQAAGARLVPEQGPW